MIFHAPLIFQEMRSNRSDPWSTQDEQCRGMPCSQTHSWHLASKLDVRDKSAMHWSELVLKFGSWKFLLNRNKGRSAHQRPKPFHSNPTCFFTATAKHWSPMVFSPSNSSKRPTNSPTRKQKDIFLSRPPSGEESRLIFCFRFLWDKNIRMSVVP